MQYSHETFESSQIPINKKSFSTFQKYISFTDIIKKNSCSEESNDKPFINGLNWLDYDTNQIKYFDKSINQRNDNDNNNNNRVYNIVSRMTNPSEISNDLAWYNPLNEGLNTCSSISEGINSNTTLEDCSNYTKFSLPLGACRMEMSSLDCKNNSINPRFSQWSRYSFDFEKEKCRLPTGLYGVEDRNRLLLNSFEGSTRNSTCDDLAHLSEVAPFGHPLSVLKNQKNNFPVEIHSQANSICSSLKTPMCSQNNGLNEFLYYDWLINDDKYSETVHNPSDCVSTANSINCFSIENNKGSSALDDTSSFSSESILTLNKDKFSPNCVSNWTRSNYNYGDFYSMQHQINHTNFIPTKKYNILEPAEPLDFFDDKNKDSALLNIPLFPLEENKNQNKSLGTLYNEDSAVKQKHNVSLGYKSKESYFVNSNSLNSMLVCENTLDNSKNSNSYPLSIQNKKVDSSDLPKLKVYSVEKDNSPVSIENDGLSSDSTIESLAVPGAAQLTLIVNVPPTTTRQDLLSSFKVFGQVIMTTVVCRKETRHPNKEWTATAGYAFVLFGNKKVARAALESTKTGNVVIRGSSVKATWAKKDSFRTKKKKNESNISIQSTKDKLIASKNCKISNTKTIENDSINSQSQCWKSDHYSNSVVRKHNNQSYTNLKLRNHKSEYASDNRLYKFESKNNKGFQSINESEKASYFLYSPKQDFKQEDEVDHHCNNYQYDVHLERNESLDNNDELSLSIHSMNSQENLLNAIKRKSFPKKNQWKSLQNESSSNLFLKDSSGNENNEVVHSNCFLKHSVSTSLKDKMYKRFFCEKSTNSYLKYRKNKKTT